MFFKGKDFLTYVLLVVILVLLLSQSLMKKTPEADFSFEKGIFYKQLNALEQDYSAKYEELTSWPEEMKIKGSLRQWQQIVFDGEELTGALWKSEPGILKIENYPYDQIVFVIKGNVFLTDSRNITKNYTAGQTFIIPKGFSGRWDMPEMYEEFIVVEKQAFQNNS